MNRANKSETTSVRRDRKIQEPWTDEQTFQLIAFWEANECLWKRNQKNSSREQVMQAKQAVAEKTNHSVADCTTLWNALKTRFNVG